MKDLKKVKTTLELFFKMNSLIINGQTGTREEFAARLGLSTKELECYLEILRNNRYSIAYSYLENTYYFIEGGLSLLNWLYEDFRNPGLSELPEEEALLLN